MATVMIALITLLSAFLFFYSWQGSKEKEYADYDAVVVLFADFMTPTSLGAESIERARFAASLASSEDLPLLCVGGFRRNGRVTGAELMIRYLSEAKFPENKMATDERSWDTISNLREIERISHQRNWRKLILVTSAMHRFRVEFLSDLLSDIEYHVVVVPESSRGIFVEIAESIREAVSLMVTVVVGTDLSSYLMQMLRVEREMEEKDDAWLQALSFQEGQ